MAKLVYFHVLFFKKCKFLTDDWLFVSFSTVSIRSIAAETVSRKYGETNRHLTFGAVSIPMKSHRDTYNVSIVRQTVCKEKNLNIECK